MSQFLRSSLLDCYIKVFKDFPEMKGYLCVCVVYVQLLNDLCSFDKILFLPPKRLRMSPLASSSYNQFSQKGLFPVFFFFPISFIFLL